MAEHQADIKIIRKSRIVRTEDGESIFYRKTVRKNERAVMLLPGFFQSESTPTFCRIADFFLSLNYDVIGVDFRGHGKSSGVYTFSSREFLDVRAVYQDARKHYTSVWAVGFSMGGSIAIIEQKEAGCFDGLICIGSPMSFGEVEKRWWMPSSFESSFRSMEKGIGCRPGPWWLKKTDAIKCLPSLNSCPVLFIHGSQDRIVYPRHSESMHFISQEPKALKIISKGGHAEDLFRTHAEEVEGVVSNFLNQHRTSAAEISE